jgi:hypothetical protein
LEQEKITYQEHLQVSSIEEETPILHTFFAFSFFVSQFLAFFSAVSRTALNHIGTFLKL